MFNVKKPLFIAPSKVAAAVEFYKTVFYAQELPPPPVGSAEIKMGVLNFIILPCDDLPFGAKDHVHTTFGTNKSIEGFLQRAVNAGAVEEEVPQDIATYYAGRRIVRIRDPFGIMWYICEGMPLPPIH